MQEYVFNVVDCVACANCCYVLSSDKYKNI